MAPFPQCLVLAAALAAVAGDASAQDAKQAAEDLRLARNAVRCSVVYGMAAAAAAARGRSPAAEIQRDLIRVAPKLGATPDRIELWLAEFDAEFREATAPSRERGRRMKDEGFMPYQIDKCQELLRTRGPALASALER